MISLNANISRRDEFFGRDRGLSSYYLRHYFVSYVTTELPCFGGPEWLPAGWQFNAISTGDRAEGKASSDQPQPAPRFALKDVEGRVARRFS
jgi:hypothetical protein